MKSKEIMFSKLNNHHNMWQRIVGMRINCQYPANWTKKEKRVLHSTLGKSIKYHDDVLLIAVNITERITDRIMYDFDVRIVTFGEDKHFRYSGTDLVKSGEKLRKMISKSIHDGDLVSIDPIRINVAKPKIKSIRKKPLEKLKIKSIRKIAG